MTQPDETLLRSERLFEGRILTLRVDHVRLPGGLTVQREIVEHGGAVAMVPLDDDGHVHLVNQYRPAIARSLLEIPAGTLEAGEVPRACAERELQEEVGQFPGKLESLGAFYPVPGYSSEYLHLFLARDLRPASLSGDADEHISVERMPLSEALERIDQGTIEDGKTIAGLLRAARFLAMADRP